MIERNGHYIVVMAKKMASTALCMKCRGEVSAINYDGQSDPSMNPVFGNKCRGDWKESRARLVAAVAEAEQALKTLRTWIAYDRTPKKLRGSFFKEENTDKSANEGKETDVQGT